MELYERDTEEGQNNHQEELDQDFRSPFQEHELPGVAEEPHQGWLVPADGGR